MNNKNIISVQLPEEVYTYLSKKAEDDFMTISAYIRKLLILNYRENINERNNENQTN